MKFELCYHGIKWEFYYFKKSKPRRDSVTMMNRQVEFLSEHRG